MFRIITALVLVALVNILAIAQMPYTENTLKLDPDRASPAATVEDMAWLAGHWWGEDMDGLSEEIWSAPRAGAMMGMYRFIKKDKTVFYELMTILEENGSIVLRLKHFNPVLKGWEEKDKTVDFRFVAKKGKTVFFDGMTFKPESDRAVTIYLAARHKDGTITEEVFRYTRGTPKGQR